MIVAIHLACLVIIIGFALWINVLRDERVRSYRNRYKKNINRII